MPQVVKGAKYRFIVEGTVLNEEPLLVAYEEPLETLPLLPDYWPPLGGDVWQDRSGGLWVCYSEASGEVRLLSAQAGASTSVSPGSFLNTMPTLRFRDGVTNGTA